MRLGAITGAATLGLTLLTAMAPAPLAADTPTTDPFLWLEEVEGERALGWVRRQNERSLGQLMADERYERFYQAALKIAEDKDRLPLGSVRGDWVYNFWQDEVSVRGLWRRASLDSYAKGTPQWETLLDIDALAQQEGQNWVFKGASCLPPTYERCMVGLSNGGKDATTYREFDIGRRSFVDGGFVLPEAKSELIWKDADTLLVATDWGPGSLTESGYAYIVKEWRRGQPLSAAREIHRGRAQDVEVAPARLQGASGQEMLIIVEANTFFTATYWTPGKRGALERLTLPSKVSLQGLHDGELVFTIEEDWIVGGRTWKAGSLLSMPASQATSPKPAVRLVYEPGPRDSIDEVEVTRAGLLVATYSNVRGRVLQARFTEGAWRVSPVPLPDSGSVSLQAADPNGGTAFAVYQGFLQPSSLYAIDSAGASRLVRSLPAKFDADKHVVEQFEVTSRDGTRVPYFVVRSKQFKADGKAPTLLYAYGGFQVSMLPSYSATIGQLWLEQGGVYVLANIRGGGEFGPSWHQAGLKTKRQVVYDDFIAVAEDLIARRITSPRHLGIQGGSNGGLLMGVMLTQRPELFRAVVVQVPLLDMLRYHKLLAGASWVDEYGSPDVPEERVWLEKLSPYQNLRKREDVPLPFLVTSTKDDRVHPGHARKYAAKLESLGMPFLYYENIDGGHSAAANLRERAKRQALEFTYLAQQLMDDPLTQ